MEIADLQQHTETDESPEAVFESIYLDVREREKRVLSDLQVMLLPEINPADIYYKEWQLRKSSSQRLVNYLLKKRRPLRILEIGCGNGWLSAKLAAIPNATVTGLDINQAEIRQARRVFEKDNLEFIGESFDSKMFGAGVFDIILFAASISYFPSVQRILDAAMPCLARNGEIHLMDSHFYKLDEVDNARLRCRDYYAAMGCPEMADRYYHHTLRFLRHFKYKMVVNPRSLINRIGRKDPFYWITISHS